MKRKALLSLLVTPVLLVALAACDTDGKTSSGGGGGTTSSSTAPSTVTTTTTTPLPSDVTPISEAQKATAGTTVTVRGKVVYVSSKSILLDDTTGKMVVWLNDTPKNAIGDYIEVKGKLAARKGNNQFDNTATITKLTESGPTINETPVTWTATELDAFVAKAEADRGIGAYIQIKGKLSISGIYYNLTVDGATNFVSLAYMPTAISSTFNDGKIYTVTGYVTDVSENGSDKMMNLYTEKGEVAAFDAVTGVTIAGEATRELAVGSALSLEANVAPFTADGNVTWTSDHTDIATVTDDGKVSGVKVGTSVITATTVGKDSSGAAKTASVTVTVTESSIQTTKETFTWVQDESKKDLTEATLTTENFNILWEINKSTSKITMAYPEFRIYKSHKVTFSSKQGQTIAKIVIHVTDAKYALTCNTSGVKADGTTALAAADIVETLDATAKTIEYDMSAAGGASSLSLVTTAQVRANTIDIYYF